MKESLAALATVLVVLAAIPIGAAGLAVTADVVTDTAGSQHDQAVPNGSSDGTVSPGAHLSGVVGRQQANIEGVVESRAFGLAIASAASNRSKASVVASQLARIRDRLAQLEERVQNLRAAHRNGSLDRGAYAAQLAEVIARIQSVEHLANQSARVSRWLPAEARAARGIDQSAIDSLQREARTIAGSNVSAVARSIGGAVDDGFTPPGLRGEAPGRPWTVPVPGRNGTGPPGPPDDVTDGIDDATDPVENATEDVENATGGVGNGTGGVGNGTDDLGNVSDGIDDAADAVDNVTDGVDNATGEVGDTVENTTDSTDNVTDPVDDVVDDVTDNSTDPVDDGSDSIDDAVDDVTDEVDNTTDPVDDVTDVIENTTDTNENETDDGSGLLGSLADSFSSTGSIGVDGTNASGQWAIDSSSVDHVVVARSM